MVAASPLAPFLSRQRLLVLDGALATELERRGADLSGGLWSAKLLAESPELLDQLHLDYLRAGADCVTTASYQATFQGFAERGLDRLAAEALLHRSVALACSARDRFWAKAENRRGRIRPLVAASLGPYGAYLADGSEYTGDYDLDEAGLVAFHRQRFELLAASAADLIACETIPAGSEARALGRLLAARPEAAAWVSFCCRNGEQLSDGTPLAEALRSVAALPAVRAVGVNCTPPRYLPALISLCRSVTAKPIVVYPNSGETWQAAEQRWAAAPETVDLALAAPAWRQAGATLIGGCCRTTPETIARLRAQLLPPAGS